MPRNICKHEYADLMKAVAIMGAMHITLSAECKKNGWQHCTCPTSATIREVNAMASKFTAKEGA